MRRHTCRPRRPSQTPPPPCARPAAPWTGPLGVDAGGRHQKRSAACAAASSTRGRSPDALQRLAEQHAPPGVVAPGTICRMRRPAPGSSRHARGPGGRPDGVQTPRVAAIERPRRVSAAGRSPRPRLRRRRSRDARAPGRTAVFPNASPGLHRDGDPRPPNRREQVRVRSSALRAVIVTTLAAAAADPGYATSSNGDLNQGFGLLVADALPDKDYEVCRLRARDDIRAPVRVVPSTRTHAANLGPSTAHRLRARRQPRAVAVGVAAALDGEAPPPGQPPGRARRRPTCAQPAPRRRSAALAPTSRQLRVAASATSYGPETRMV